MKKKLLNDGDLSLKYLYYLQLLPNLNLGCFDFFFFQGGEGVVFCHKVLN